MNNEVDPNGKSPHEPGAKLDSGKTYGALLLKFARALTEVADIGTFGANKYTRDGWESVPNAKQRYLDAAFRHLLKSGFEEVDPDSNHTHIGHVIWNLLAVRELELREKANDSRKSLLQSTLDTSQIPQSEEVYRLQ